MLMHGLMYVSIEASDRLRWKDMLRVMRYYWVGVAVLVLAVPDGGSSLRGAVTCVVRHLPTVNRAAAASFDPGFIEVFVVACLIWSCVLMASSIVAVRGGSHMRFDSIGAKAVMVALTMLMWVVTWLTLRFGPTEISLSGGRAGAFLYFGTTSRFGAASILAGLWGFAQLFFFFAMRLVIASPSSLQSSPGPRTSCQED
ncbi:hypothetical protein LZ009_14200 [Ramlibacter sp. XY19]|uniref:hypothetical protein n=1 Tax=Ramlibacter paludis TaxID=2908000 RepID=UPI0023DA14BA|nr:hypothetical protein [Ramlibacter paludis]MCG2593930.1 hypothetical protein [Ramlibacter paludis]